MAVLATVLTLGGLAACTPETPPASHGGPVQDQVSLIDALRAHGHEVQPMEAVKQPFLEVPGNTLHVDGQTVQVFEYADDGSAARDAAKIQPDGSVPTMMIDWTGQPHFYRTGRIIVVYVGSETGVLEGLRSALGEPFAVGPDGLARPPVVP